MLGLFTAEQLFEACIPLGTGHVPREVKAKACRRVLVDGWAIDRAAFECGVAKSSVYEWVGEIRIRMQMARNMPNANKLSLKDPSACINAAMAVMDVDIRAFRGRGRPQAVVIAREIAIALLRKHTIKSYPELAEIMGRPNHSSLVTSMMRFERVVDDPLEHKGVLTSRRELLEQAERLVANDGDGEERASRRFLDRVCRTDAGEGPRRVDEPPRHRGIADVSQRAVRLGRRPVESSGSGGYEVEAG